jgi:hypothetical protein
MNFQVIFDYFYLWELLLILTYFLIGFYIIIVVARKPKWFWPILTAVNVGTSGLMIAGYCLIEEYFTGCIVLGGILASDI